MDKTWDLDIFLLENDGFTIHPYEYSRENYLKFEGNKYKIIRTYQRNYEELEVICRLNLGDRNE